MPGPEIPKPRGRGSQLDLPNRFERTYRELDLEQVEWDDDYLQSLEHRATEYLPDRSRSIVSENDSPDVGFRYSINPYRGCLHGCSYCFARPTHEYLGFNAGLDFESKIMVKENAPELFREFLSRPKWKPEPIAISGVTDCYQPAERTYRLTRGCLEVASESKQPMMIITKNALVVRDLDLIAAMAAENRIHVNLSITTLDPSLARSMEPRTSTPLARLRAVKTLADAGVPVRVLIAPVIPGLNDSEIPAILEASKEAGAKSAGFTLLRLPLAVGPVFIEWLEREQPGRVKKVLDRLKDARGGRLNDPNFGSRMRGSGERADQIANLFRLFRKKYNLDGLPPLDASQFRPPTPKTGQLRLF
jgi:DNA repair photolyase